MKRAEAEALLLRRLAAFEKTHSGWERTNEKTYLFTLNGAHWMFWGYIATDTDPNWENPDCSIGFRARYEYGHFLMVADSTESAEHALTECRAKVLKHLDGMLLAVEELEMRHEPR